VVYEILQYAVGLQNVEQLVVGDAVKGVVKIQCQYAQRGICVFCVCNYVPDLRYRI